MADEARTMNRFGVAAEWRKQGYWGRVDCMGCGFAMIGGNRSLHVGIPGRGPGVELCDGCVELIASVADGELHSACGGRLDKDDPAPSSA